MRLAQHYIILIAGILLIFTLSLAAHAKAQGDDAYSFYRQGLEAQTIGEREQSLEKALQLYLGQYNKMKEKGEQNGLLTLNIGNCYFNLGQNEEAIFYYRLGNKLLPRSEKIKANLAIALEKRENAVDPESNGLLEDLLVFHYKLSFAERIQLVVFFAFIAAMSLAWLIIKPNITMRYTAIITSLALVSLSASLAAEYYNPKHIGILMQITDVRRGAGSEFAPITAHPFGGGSSLEVLSLKKGWYQVQLNDGRKGFVEQVNLRVLTL
jgi:tetratricopeptide (TPR) repeat protein